MLLQAMMWTQQGSPGSPHELMQHDTMSDDTQPTAIRYVSWRRLRLKVGLCTQLKHLTRWKISEGGRDRTESDRVLVSYKIVQ